MSEINSVSCSTEINTTEANSNNVNEVLLNKINHILESVIEENKKLSNYKEKVSSQKNQSFTSYNKPSLSIREYLMRIQYYSEAEDNTFIVGLIYIDRVSELSSIILTPYNIHRVLFTALFLAIKYNEDVNFDDIFYSKVSGMGIKEVKKLERDFVDLIGFQFFVKKEEFLKYKSFIDEINLSEEESLVNIKDKKKKQ